MRNIDPDTKRTLRAFLIGAAIGLVFWVLLVIGVLKCLDDNRPKREIWIMPGPAVTF